MMPTTAVPPPADNGLIFSGSLLHSEWFAVLATFVALNTIMYCALALAKMLPKIYVTDWLHTRNRRAQTRSIYPDGWEPSGDPVVRDTLDPVR